MSSSPSAQQETAHGDTTSGATVDLPQGFETGQEELIAPEETTSPPVVPLPAALTAHEATVGDAARSPTPAREPVASSESRVATPRPTGATRQYTATPGLPLFLPSPPSVPRNTTIGVHHGPASSSSLSSYRPGLNPAAPSFTPADNARAQEIAAANLARAYRERGPPPGARNPAEIYNDPGAGDVVVTPAEAARYRASAARHAARVFQRLIDAESEIHANFLDREFERIFGQEYRDAVVHVIQDPPPDTDEEQEEEEEEEQW